MRRVELTAIGVVVAAGLVAGCASSPWPKSRSQIVTTAPACEDFAVQIYFERDSAEVTNEARSVLKSAGVLTKGCKVDSVRVLGLADAVGASDVNLALSKTRATAVTSALAKVGFRNVEFDVAAAGDTGSITGSGEARPLRRRADVKFDLAGPAR
ncbi:outer membrane protein/peptidoglycan-associated lipoprotein [Caulobacter sp. AP07]|uniref:OmpA family protein n=1 Tax=Caulobacter sp. AP07 TaxID=1144304 RepID=UPI000271F710|nr:OmpA family protein [Caulobacter sp. AP07]EJL37402.1 outer membrane protein/peptidoglycan-associated lipoprotein [Caulobacter sp. AP07]